MRERILRAGRRALVPVLAVGAVLAAAAGGSAAASGGSSETLDFRSAPGLHPPRLSVTPDSDRGSGDIFLAPFNSPQVGPMIVDSQGHLIWFRPLPHTVVMNLQVQRYHGRPVLTWWQGALSVGHGTIYGQGQDVIVDDSYRTVAVVHAGDGDTADLHEFQVTPAGTALLDAYVPVHRNLTSLGGPANGTVLDCVVQELDLRTGRVLWEWHAVDHVPLTASYWPVSMNPKLWFDYFHINSIQQLPDGNLLISSRNTWAIYEISRKTGRVIWTLGGKHSSFRMGAGTNFEWQHDARLSGNGVLSLFDDASSPPEEREASAKLLHLDTRAMTARLLHRYPHSPGLLPGLAGSAELLADRDVFVGWGGSPDFSEYAPGGRQIFNATFPPGMGSYRVLRFSWVGHPVSAPAVALLQGRVGQVTAYASWNGATQVVRWRLLEGSTASSLKPVGLAHPRTGFETAMALRGSPAFVAVEALDGAGRILGRSRARAS